jgi:predicted DsbA family dithiol-disulfide isomerase
MVGSEQKLIGNKDTQHKADQVEIIYYTDPLCCYSWAFEPQWRRLRYEFEGKISWQYIMGGLLPSWNNYNDELNSVTRPVQMGPVWMQASHISGMPIPDRIWMENPPASSYPACIAVKCAQIQSGYAGERYLRLVREAIMLHGKNIAEQKVLYDIADDLQKEQPSFDAGRFKADMKNDYGIEAFRSDLQQVQYRNINRFPTLILRQADQPAIMMTGYRPYPVLLDAVKQVAPNLQKVKSLVSAEDYISYWGSITQRELDEVMHAAVSV